MNFLTVTMLLVVVYMETNSVDASATIDNYYHMEKITDAIPYKMPDSCATMNYCLDKGSNYPDKTIEDLLKDMRDWPQVADSQSTNLEFDVQFREGDNPKGNADCPANSIYAPIYYIVDTEDKVRVVIQSPDFPQFYSVRWCKNEARIDYDTKHFIRGSYALTNFTVSCVNTYMDFDFYVLNDDFDPTVERAKAKGGIPVCCKCKYSKL